MTRPGVAVLACALFVGALDAVQWLVTSPGRITYGECRLMILAGIPAMVTALSAHWVDNGRRNR